MDPQQAAQIRTQLVRDLGVAQLPEMMQDEIITRVTQNIVISLGKETEQRIPDEARPEFERLQSEGEKHAVQAYLEEIIPGYDALIQNIVRMEILNHQRSVGAA